MSEVRGSLVELDVGAVAHGGHCVARYEGRAVFVRHALPGERVRAQITEERGSYLRADAVEILQASADRVAPPCRFAGPGRCGGCDWQHAAIDAQRRMKADVVCEVFARLAGLDVRALLGDVVALDGGALRWRTRIDWSVSPDGVIGLRRHRSHEIEAVDACLLGDAGVGTAPGQYASLSGITGISLVRGENGETSVLALRPGPGRQARGRRPPDRVELVAGPEQVHHTVAGHDVAVRASGFWQVHPRAASTYAEAVVTGLDVRPGDVVLELYSGSGALTVPLAEAVGQTGRVVGLELSRGAVEDAALNLRDRPWASVRRARVDAAAITGLDVRPDLIVLDPPRAGAGAELTRALTALRARAIGYVACDPASLARDVAAARSAGWELSALRAYDGFPMTHHIECVAILTPGT